MKKILFIITFFILGAPSLFSEDSQNVGTITRLQGEVQIFTHPSNKVTGPPPHVLFEGEYYSVKNALVGSQVIEGNIVRTTVGGMATLIFPNGDQIYVGSATAYRVHLQAKEKTSSLRLLYGKLRNVISTFGPRKNLQVQTPAATMGVRGTDFYVASVGTEERVNVSVLRGEVDLKSTRVKAGQTGEALNKSDVRVHDVYKEDLQDAKELTSLKQTSKDAAILKLEQKATQSVKNEIKVTNSALYAQVKDAQSLESVTNTAVAQMMKTASSKPLKKPSQSEFEKLKQDSYKNYFEKVD